MTAFLALVITTIILAPVVQRSDNAFHWIDLHPLNNAIHFASTYPLGSDLSVG